MTFLVIIALLLLALVSTTAHSRNNLRDERLRSNLLRVRLALELWRAEHGRYPHTVEEFEARSVPQLIPVLINPYTGSVQLLTDAASGEDPAWGEIRYRYRTNDRGTGPMEEWYVLQAFDGRGRPLPQEVPMHLQVRTSAFVAAS